MTPRNRRRVLLATGALLASFVLAACSTTTSPAAAPASSASSSSTQASSSLPPAQAPVTITHIHAVAHDTGTDELLLATHEGLVRHVAGELRPSGPAIDLMGFAVGPDGAYYASGHPGAGVDLPEPVGLITSTDAGRTWRVLSRGGQSDFHALTAGPSHVVGFDGSLRVTSDRQSWTTRSIPAPPRGLAASPGSGRLLATTASGLLSSTDAGASWTSLTPPEPALLPAWADEQTIVIATTGGRLAMSTDAGATWVLHPARIGVAEALFAQRGKNGLVEVIVVVQGEVLRSLDGGATFEKFLS